MMREAWTRLTSSVGVLTVLGVLIATPAIGSAQVLEIGDGGAVTIHDRPEVMLRTGTTPIQARGSSPRAATTPATSATNLSDAATAAELSPALVEAVAWSESRMRHGLVSTAGAIGEMQLMPRTARALGVDPFDSRQNFAGGAAYLSGLMKRYDGDLVRALAAYNAGPGAVDRFGGVPPYKETRAYVGSVLDRLSLQAVAPTER